MKKVIGCFRTAALFVGSVVGAGFATGQEVALFFGGDGILGILVASLFMALCAFCFSEIGYRRALGEKTAFLTDVLVSLSSFAVYAAMIAAAEEVLFSLSGLRGLSSLLAIGILFFAGRKMGATSLLNLVAVPFMIVVIVLVGGRSGGKIVGGFHPLYALSYGGMNLLFSGALMVKAGEESSRFERIGAALLSGAAIFLMLFFMRRCLTGVLGDMPFLIVADRENLGRAARVAVLLAIVTTMASCAYLCVRFVSSVTGDPLLSAPVVALVGILVASFGFARIVRLTYPVVSFLGLIATVLAITISALSLFRKRGRFAAKFSNRKSFPDT